MAEKEGRKKRTKSKELLQRPRGPGVPLIKDSKTLKTFKIGSSTTLSQVKSFLPSLARANKELEDTMKEEGGKDRVNIESEHEGATQCIQLDLALVQYDEEGEEEEEVQEEEERRKIILPNDILQPSKRKLLQIEELK